MTDPRLLAAAEWAGKRDRNAATRARFDRWIAEPGNAAAWQTVAAAQTETIALADHPDLLALRHATVAQVMRDGQHGLARRVTGMAAALAVIAAVPLSVWYVARDPAVSAPAHPVSYATETGQRLNVMLPDGSRLTLDTASRVRVAYTGAERRLVLERGQALFEVAKQQARPFVVAAGERQIVAHGTKFDVRLDPDALRVALVEGKVSVAAGGAAPVAMVPDDVLTADAAGTAVTHVPGQAAALASWSEGELVFDNATLAQAVAEIGRYGTPPIRIADAKAGRLRISGSFRTGETAPFLETLELGFPVRVTRTAGGSAEVRSRPAK